MKVRNLTISVAFSLPFALGFGISPLFADPSSTNGEVVTQEAVERTSQATEENPRELWTIPSIDQRTPIPEHLERNSDHSFFRTALESTFGLGKEDRKDSVPSKNPIRNLRGEKSDRSPDSITQVAFFGSDAKNRDEEKRSYDDRKNSDIPYESGDYSDFRGDSRRYNAENLPTDLPFPTDERNFSPSEGAFPERNLNGDGPDYRETIPSAKKSLGKKDSQQEEEITPEKILAKANRSFDFRKFNQAEKLYQQYLTMIDPNATPWLASFPYHRLGLIARERQQIDKAQTYLIKAIQTDIEKNPRITLDYAVILYDIREYERALNLFNFLVTNYPELKEARHYLAQTLLNLDPNEKLLPLLEETLERGEACRILADKCREMGREEEAQKIEKLLKADQLEKDQIFFMGNVKEPGKVEKTPYSSDYGPVETTVARRDIPQATTETASTPSASLESAPLEPLTAGQYPTSVTKNDSDDSSVNHPPLPPTSAAAFPASDEKPTLTASASKPIDEPFSLYPEDYRSQKPLMESPVLNGPTTLPEASQPVENDKMSMSLQGDQDPSSEKFAPIPKSQGAMLTATFPSDEPIERNRVEPIEKVGMVRSDLSRGSNETPVNYGLTMGDELPVERGIPKKTPNRADSSITDFDNEDWGFSSAGYEPTFRENRGSVSDRMGSAPSFNDYRLPAGEVKKSSALPAPKNFSLDPNPNAGKKRVPEISKNEFPSLDYFPESERTRIDSRRRNQEINAPTMKGEIIPLGNNPPRSGGRRLTSEEKLLEAQKAGAKITYLTPEQYKKEIATRAGTMVQSAKEEIRNNPRMTEEEKAIMIQKIEEL